MNANRTVTTRKARKNGINAPKRAGFISYAWDLFDSAKGKTILAAHMPHLSQLTGLNLENLLIELRRWKRFNGLPTGERG